MDSRSTRPSAAAASAAAQALPARTGARAGVWAIRWTADPLAAPALALYLHGLGARLVGYAPGLYADVRPATVTPDDVLIEWPLHDPRRSPPAAAARRGPTRTSALRDVELGRWRLDVRRAMTAALERGAVGVDVAVDRSAGRAWVLFARGADARRALDHRRRRRRRRPPGGGAGYEHRLSRWSERTTGSLPASRGSSRCWRVRRRATFYVPGVTAERHPDEIVGLAEAGTRSATTATRTGSRTRLPAADQRARSPRARGAARDHRPPPARLPRPGWELTRGHAGRARRRSAFAWDSSLMGDDRPYLVEAAGRRAGRAACPLGARRRPALRPHDRSRRAARGLGARARAGPRRGRHVTVTLHPEILGRAHRVDVLRRLLDGVAGQSPASRTVRSPRPSRREPGRALRLSSGCAGCVRLRSAGARRPAHRARRRGERRGRTRGSSAALVRVRRCGHARGRAARAGSDRRGRLRSASAARRRCAHAGRVATASRRRSRGACRRRRRRCSLRRPGSPCYRRSPISARRAAFAACRVGGCRGLRRRRAGGGSAQWRWVLVAVAALTLGVAGVAAGLPVTAGGIARSPCVGCSGSAQRS